MKTRIVKRTSVDGSNVTYVIQQKHFIFRWWWVDAWVNSWDMGTNDTFYTYEDAVNHLCFFDGSREKVEVVTGRTFDGYSFSFGKRNPNCFTIEKAGNTVHMVCTPPVERTCDIFRLGNPVNTKYEFDTDSIVIIRNGNTRRAYYKGELVAHHNG